MTQTDFLARLSAVHMHPDSRTAVACGMVLLRGLTGYAAAHKVGINESAVSRALAKIRNVQVCPTCGGAVPH